MANELRFLGRTSAAVSPQLRFSIDSARMGPPGIPEEIHFVGSRKPLEAEEGIRRLNDDRPRPFEIVCRLGKTAGGPEDSVDFALDPREGGSFLTTELASGIVGVGTPDGTLELHSNALGEVAAVVFRCVADSRRAALDHFDKVVMPYLDHASFAAGVPIHIRSVFWRDVTNEAYGGTYSTPFPQARVPEEGAFPRALIPVYALYREALCSGSAFYSFLCYAKILEGLFGPVRARIHAAAAASNIKIQRKAERVPNDSKLTGPAKRFVGKAIQGVFEEHLKPTYRVAIAHFNRSDEEPLIVSNYLAAGNVTQYLYLIQICCRVAICTNEDCLRQLSSQGVVVL